MKTEERRYKLFSISPESFLLILTGEAEMGETVFPKDSRVANATAHLSFEMNLFSIIVYNKNFPIIPIGESIPLERRVTLKRKGKKPDGVHISKRPLSKKKVKKLQEEWHERYRGQGQIKYLGKAMKKMNKKIQRDSYGCIIDSGKNKKGGDSR